MSRQPDPQLEIRIRNTAQKLFLRRREKRPPCEPWRRQPIPILRRPIAGTRAGSRSWERTAAGQNFARLGRALDTRRRHRCEQTASNFAERRSLLLAGSLAQQRCHGGAAN